LACAVNSACLALMNSGNAMKFLVAAVSCMIDHEDKTIIDPDSKQLKVRYACSPCHFIYSISVQYNHLPFRTLWISNLHFDFIFRSARFETPHCSLLCCPSSCFLSVPICTLTHCGPVFFPLYLSQIINSK
jgi:hypothetical protein